MEFKRRFRTSRVFQCDSGEGDYRFARPSGVNTRRKALDFSCRGRDFEIRTEGEELWLLEGEVTIGYGTGEDHRWHLILDDLEYVLDQSKLGVNHSTLETMDGKLIAQTRGIGFPITRVELVDGAAFSDDEKAFITWSPRSRGAKAIAE